MKKYTIAQILSAIEKVGNTIVNKEHPVFCKNGEIRVNYTYTEPLKEKIERHIEENGD